MKSMHLPIASCVLGLTLSGCSALQTAEPGTDDSCGALQQTIESYDTGFENLRGKASNRERTLRNMGLGEHGLSLCLLAQSAR